VTLLADKYTPTGHAHPTGELRSVEERLLISGSRRIGARIKFRPIGNSFWAKVRSQLVLNKGRQGVLRSLRRAFMSLRLGVC